MREPIKGFWAGGSEAPKNGRILRTQLQDKVQYDLGTGQILAIGPRQSGKSVMLKGVVREIEESKYRPWGVYRAFYLSLEFAGRREQEYFSSGTALRDFITELNLTISRQGVAPITATTLGEVILALPQGTLLALDEYNSWCIGVGNFLPLIRGHLEQGRSGLTRVILADQSQESAARDDGNSPFNNISTTHRVVGWEKDECGIHVNECFLENGIYADYADGGPLYPWTNGDPFLTNVLGMKVVEILAETPADCPGKSDMPHVTPAVVENAAMQVINNADLIRWQTLARYYRTRFGDTERRTLQRILSGQKIWFDTGNKFIEPLVANGFVVSDRNGDCMIRNKMTTLFLRRHIQTLTLVQSPDSE